MKVNSFDSKTGKLILEIDLNMKGTKSASGKSNVHFSTSGNQSLDKVIVDGKPLTIGINAYTKA